MSITVVISAQVSDFDQWKSKFDGLGDQRVAAGINARAYRKQMTRTPAMSLALHRRKTCLLSFLPRRIDRQFKTAA